MTFQITERGKRVVESPEFIQHIRSVLREQDECTATERAQIAFVEIAWALAGRSIDAPPRTEQETTDFTIFLLNNKKAIREMSDKLTATLFREDFGPVN